jgi:hypothetical protein
MVERPPPCLDAGRTLGPDLVLAVRADNYPDLTTVLDVVERGVAHRPSAGVEPVAAISYPRNQDTASSGMTSAERGNEGLHAWRDQREVSIFPRYFAML